MSNQSVQIVFLTIQQAQHQGACKLSMMGLSLLVKSESYSSENPRNEVQVRDALQETSKPKEICLADQGWPAERAVMYYLQWNTYQPHCGRRLRYFSHGSTVYIEPRAVSISMKRLLAVGQTSAMKIQRILQAMSDMIRPHGMKLPTMLDTVIQTSGVPRSV